MDSELNGIHFRATLSSGRDAILSMERIAADDDISHGRIA